MPLGGAENGGAASGGPRGGWVSEGPPRNECKGWLGGVGPADADMVCGMGGGPVKGLGLMLAGGYCGPPWSPRGPKAGGPLVIGETPAFGGSAGGPVVKGEDEKGPGRGPGGPEGEGPEGIGLEADDGGGLVPGGPRLAAMKGGNVPGGGPVDGGTTPLGTTPGGGGPPGRLGLENGDENG